MSESSQTKMAILLQFCGVLLLCVVLAVAELNAPCNDQYTDCGAGECCAIITGAKEGYKGVCQKYKSINQACTPGEPKEGECGCVRWMICARYFGDNADADEHRCQVILLPGRK